MQIEHKKNTAYYLVFPGVDSSSPASFKTGVSPVDTGYYKDGAGAWTSLAITDTAAEIGSTGIYEIDLTAAEMNHDQVMIKFAVSGMADTAFLFDMRTKIVSDLNDISTAEVNTECDTALTDYDAPTKAELDSGFAALNDPTAASIADAVLDEALSGHVVAGSLGKAVADIETDATDILADTADMQPKLGTPAGASISADIATVDSNVDAILVDTGTTLDGKLDTIDGIVDAILVDTGTTLPATLTTIDGNVDAILLDTGTDGVVISATTANEIADALLKRDFSAVSGESARSALNALRFLRNKYSIDGTTLTVTKEDDSTSAWTSVLTTDAAADPVTGSDPA